MQVGPETEMEIPMNADAPSVHAGLQVAPRSAFKSRAALAIVALALLAWLPFINQAFTIDDTNFLALAAHARPRPLDLYDFSINWRGEEERAFDILANPPLVPWYLALVSTIARGREWVFHLSFWPFLVLTLAGAYRLGRRFALTQDPSWTMLWTAVAPGLVVAAHTVMPDLPLLACYVLGLALTIDAFDQDRPAFAVGGGLLAGCSAVCRYSGMTVIPLLLLYALLNRVRPRTAAPGILAASMPIAAWTLASYKLYGSVHWMAMASFEGQGGFNPGELIHTTVYQISSLTLAIVLAPLLVLLFDRELRRSVAGYAAAVVIAVAIGLKLEPWLPLRMTATAAVLLAVGIAGGSVTAVLIARTILRAQQARVWSARGGPEADDLFLSCWVLGILTFNLFLRFGAVRYILPALVPAVLLFQRAHRSSTRSRRGWWLATTVSLALAVLLSISDGQFAGLYRTYAATLPAAAQQRWFTGHWGFQYYMEGTGARALSSASPIRPGDEIVTSTNPWPQAVPREVRLEQVARTEIAGLPGLRTLTYGGDGFFYADWVARGDPIVFLPYGISGEPLEVLTRWKVVSINSQLGRDSLGGAAGSPVSPTAADFLNLSLQDYQAGHFKECIAAAQEALRLAPDMAEAYNNLAACDSSLAMWDAAIQAAEEALRLKPDFQLARNNLAWAIQQKQIQANAHK